MSSKKQEQDRRAFLKKSGKAAVAAPAVALLLSANARQASAQEDQLYGGSGNDPITGGSGGD